MVNMNGTRNGTETGTRRVYRGRRAVDRTWKMVVIPTTQRARKVRQIANSALSGVLATGYAERRRQAGMRLRVRLRPLR